MKGEDRLSGSWPGYSMVEAGMRALGQAVHDLDETVGRAIARFRSDMPPPPDPDPPERGADDHHDDEPPPASPPALAA